MIKLNEEFMAASPERRKEIELQIIGMVPKDEYAGDQQVTELSKLQSELKDKINALGECATKNDVVAFFNQIKELDEKIYNEAMKLGVELNKVDYGAAMARILEAKFGKSNEN